MRGKILIATGVIIALFSIIIVTLPEETAAESVQLIKEITLCQEKTKPLECKERTYDTLIKRYGLSKALTVIKIAAQQTSFDVNCHELGHYLGRTYYNQFLKKPFAASGNLCDGFIHGLIEAIIRAGGSSSIDKIVTLCKSEDITEYNNCIHGVGHALYFSDYNEAKFVSVCVKIAGMYQPIKGYNYVPDCVEGYGMEYNLHKDISKEVERSNLSSFCHSYYKTKDEADYCILAFIRGYQYSAREPGSLSLEELIKRSETSEMLCASFENRGIRASCYVNQGQSVFDSAISSRKELITPDNFKIYKAHCGPTLNNDCLLGLTYFIKSNYPKDGREIYNKFCNFYSKKDEITRCLTVMH